jgi:hypothetical protein
MTAPFGRSARVRVFRVFSVAGVSGRRRTTISALVSSGVQTIRAMGGLDARDVLGRSRPAQHPEVQRCERLGAGRAQDAKAQHGNRAVACQGRSGACAPDAVLAVDMRVHPQVVAQHVARDPLHHAFGQAVIDHARQRDLERGIAGHVLHPCPEVQDRLEPRVGGEVRQAAVGRVDDVVDLRRGGVHRERRMAEPGLCQRCPERGFVLVPTLRLRGEEDDGGFGGHGRLPDRFGTRASRAGLRRPAPQRGRWTWADCTSPKATISTSIADPP